MEDARSKSARRWVSVSIAVVALAAVAAGVYSIWLRPRTPVVQVTTVHTQNLKNTIFASGSVKPLNRQVLSVTDLPAPVAKMEVEVGQHVKVGQELFYCDRSSAYANLQTAEAQATDAKKAYNTALENLKSAQSALARSTADSAVGNPAIGSSSPGSGAPATSATGTGIPGTVSGVQVPGGASSNTAQAGTLQDAQAEASLEAQVQATQNTLTQANAAVTNARQAYASMTIKATISGTVLIASPQGIEPDGTTGPVVEVANGRSIIASLSQSDAVNVKKGMPVTVTSQSFPGKEWSAQITMVSPYAMSDTSGNGQVEVTVGKLPSHFPVPLGYQVDLNIVSQVHHHVLVVPYSALVQSGTSYSVFIVKNGRVQEVPVTLGITSNNRVEVVKGLTDNEEVVLNPPANLQNGMDVRV